MTSPGRIAAFLVRDIIQRRNEMKTKLFVALLAAFSVSRMARADQLVYQCVSDAGTGTFTAMKDNIGSHKASFVSPSYRTEMACQPQMLPQGTVLRCSDGRYLATLRRNRAGRVVVDFHHATPYALASRPIFSIFCR